MKARVLGVVLAGGQARRMGGGDKCRLDLGGDSLVGHVIARLAPQCDALVLNANGDPARFADLGLPVLGDSIAGFPGPLAGVLAGMDHGAVHGFSHVLSAAADTPFLPPDLAHRLADAAREAGLPIALAATREGGRLIRHPTFGLWPVSLREDLRAQVMSGLSKVALWADRHGAAPAVFPSDPIDPFFNINTPDELAIARDIWHKTGWSRQGITDEGRIMRIYGITGRKNAGKTTLMERLVAELTGRGYRISTVKHAHHETEIDQPGRDSHRHRQAGAEQVLLASPVRWALMHELRGQDEPSLQAHLQRLDPVDLVLVEGFKQAGHPQLEVWRRATGRPPLAPEFPSIRALVSDQGDGGTGLPVLAPDDISAIADFVIAQTGLDLPRRGAPMPADPVPVDQVLARLRASVQPLQGEVELPLWQASGHVLARDALARRSHPPATNAAMDGYGFAFDSVDFAALPVPLAQGRAAAGAPFAGALPPGQALRVLTGAVLPEGVDTVAPQEHALIEGAMLRLDPAPARKGANIRPAGEDMEAGQVALKAGTILRPQEIGLAAALGIGSLLLRPRLRVGVLSTGEELVQPDQPDLEAGRIPDANRPMLLSMLARMGFQPVDLGIIGDDRELLRAALNDAAGQVDAILTSGGASQGDEDHVSALLRDEAELQDWRVAIKPGRPLALAHWPGEGGQRIPIFGLPGNPVAALVCALVFAAPALFQRAGAGWRAPVGFQLPAGFARLKQPGRREYLRARLEDGRVQVFASEGSGRISGLSWADGLVELPDGFADIRPGDPVRYIPWSGFGL